MLALTPKAAGKPIEILLQDILNTDTHNWSNSLQAEIKKTLENLAQPIKNHNFFSDYSINTVLYFLKTYVKKRFIIGKLYDSNVLKNLNLILHNFKNLILKQNSFDKKQIIIATNYLDFFKQFLTSDHRHLLENNYINLQANDLKQIAIKVVEKNNGTFHDFIATYLSTLKLSFDVMVFLQDYQKAYEGIVSITRIMFLQKDININLAISQCFSSLAYECKLIDYYKKKLNLSDPQLWQENIMLATKDLQQYFFANIDKRKDISRPALKYYFFKYFLQEADIQNPLKSRYAEYLSYYADKDFNPLPDVYKCPSEPYNQFTVRHDNLEKDKLEIVCQAKACADRNHAEWLQRIGNNQNHLDSHYIYHIFNNATSYESDIYRFINFEPISAGIFTGILRNKTNVIGKAYAQYRSDPTSWWQVSAHEYAHHLNFRAFGSIPRSLDEGLAYRLIFDSCYDTGFQSWLRVNLNNYTSLDLLSSQDFIGYNPSSLFMSYFVDTNSRRFAEILNLYQRHNISISLRMTQLIQQDNGFLPWLDAYQQRCSNHTFRPLGEGNNYCPDLLQRNWMEKKYPENLLTGKTSMPTIFKKTFHPATSVSRNFVTEPALLTIKLLNADEMGRELIFKISKNQLADFKQLLQNGANPDYRENGNTPLHYLYFYGNCDTQYLEALLTHHATISTNTEGLLPYQMAEKACSATQLQIIKDIFSRYTPPINLDVSTSKPEETGLIPYQQKKLAITIAVPISSLVSGVIAGGWKEISERHNQQYPYLRNFIFYGLQPASLAASSAIVNTLVAGSAEAIGLEGAGLSFSCYLVINYFGMLLAQLGEKVTKKIKNKLLNFLMPVLLYTFFLNPSLFVILLSEGLILQSFQSIMMPLLSMISSGIFFKAGEYVSQKTSRKIFPLNSENSSNDSKKYIRYSLGGTPKIISSDLEPLQNIEKKLNSFISQIKKVITNQAYKLSFDKDITSATANLTALIEVIRKGEQAVNRQEYEKKFKEFEKDLEQMQHNLNLLSKDGSKINSLWKEVTKILTFLREIRPLPQVNNSPDLVTNPARIDVLEERSNTPLMSSSTNTSHTNNDLHDDNETAYYQVPSKLLRSISSLFTQTKPDFPPAPTEEELQEMMGAHSQGNFRSMSAKL